MEFGYARVSTTHQNTDRQIDALREYGISERNIIVDKQWIVNTFSDKFF